MTKGKTVVHIDIGERQIEDIQRIDVIVTTKYNTRILYDKWYMTEQEEPKMGYWFVDERPESDREIICSNCEQPIFKYHKMDFDYRPKYCPNCGAKMVESQEGDDEWDRVTMIDVNGNIHKVTFKKEDIGDYPDEIPNQFDNLTGSMNV